MSKIFNIPEAASIAIHSMVLIANSKELINASRIAELTNSSKNHISKILHLLVKYDYLDSTRGPLGGFTINSKAKNATLLEIYELIEGTIQTKKCGTSTGKCPFKECIFGGLTDKFTNEFKHYLSQKKIKEIF